MEKIGNGCRWWYGTNVTFLSLDSIYERYDNAVTLWDESS